MAHEAETRPARAISMSRLLLLCVLIPVALMGLAAWQWQRSATDAVQYGTALPGMRDTAAQLAGVAAQDPMRLFHFDGLPGSYAAPVAAGMVQDGVGRLDRDLIVARLREGVAAGTALAALLALAAGCTGLAIASRVARTGLQTRDRLVVSFTRIQRLLPGLLATIAASTLVAVSFAVLFEAAGAWYLEQINGAELKLVAVGLAVAGGGLWLAVVTLRQLFRAIATFKPEPRPILGRSVSAADAPGLWAVIHDLVVRQQALPPDNVVLGLVDGFFVTASDIALAPGARILTGQTLYIPAPYLALLDASETAAIICHELAHFAGEDTAYSQRFLPVYVGIERSLSIVNKTRTTSGWGLLPAAALGLHMMEVFDTAVQHWSRVREFAADAAALPITGAPAIGSALIRTAGIAGIVDTILGETARHPASAPADLVAAMADRAMHDGLGDPSPYLADRQPHPTDSHPPTFQRIQAAGLTIDDGLLARSVRPVQPGDSGFATGLFQDWPGLCRLLSADAIAVAIRRDRQYEKALHEAAAAPQQAETVLYEDIRKSVWSMGLFAAAFLGISVFITYVLVTGTAADPSASATIMLADAGLLLTGGVLLALTLQRAASRHTPFLTLTTDGFQCRGLDRTVRWGDVVRVGVTANRGLFTTFWLAPGCELPVRVSGYRTRVMKGRPRVTLLGHRPKGLSPQAYLGLILTYRSAAQARQALAEREVPAPYVKTLSEDELQALLDQPDR